VLPLLAPVPLVAASATTAIVVAVIAALGSLIVTLVSQELSRRANRDLAERTRRLEDEGKARDAWLDYEYEAKKRLYEECEPLLFQTIELAENARARVVSLARSAKAGDIRPDGAGWLSHPGYYYTSTAFQLLAPMTSFKILQHRLTSIDLSLEPRIRRQYELIKLLFLSFVRDFELAAREPALAYEPDRADPGRPERDRLLADDPAVYGRQGLYRGTLDVVVDALVSQPAPGSKDAAGGVERCKTFGEFLAEFDDAGSPVAAIRPELEELFGGFHPRRRPVLWRLLVGQALLYDEFLRARPDPAELERSFDWGGEPEEVATAIRVASAWVGEELAGIKTMLAPAP
jgi:hypothetical protein